MDTLSGLAVGFQTVLQPINLLFCFVGVFIGTLIGVLPGIGPIGAMSVLLPTTFGISPAAAVIMLGGIYYGAMYGGSTTSILVNIPGEAASVVTCLDGYQMARRGRAGPALGISALASFVGGTFSIIALMFLVLPLNQVALRFGPPEYFSLICMAMTFVTYVASKSMIKSIIMILVGMMLGTVGMDSFTATHRFTFGSASLSDGIGLIPVAMGLFGISEVLMNLRQTGARSILNAKLKNLLPNLDDWKRSIAPIIRGSFIGFFLGILPGGGAVLASFVSYSVEKKVSKHPETFGHGAIEGVAGPETANNAGAGGSFVPLLAMGIPTTPTMGLLLAALIIHGVTPGPLMFGQHPEIFWGVIASMYIGNVMLLILNLPLIGLWVKLLKVPYRILMPLILLFCLIGAYSVNNNPVDVITVIIFGIVGYVLRRYDYEGAPLILAFLLGPMLETALRRSLIISGGKFSIFVHSPISAVLLSVSALLFISAGFSAYGKAKTKLAENIDIET